LPEISQPFACKNLAGNGCFCDTSKAMSVVIELDDNLVAEIDKAADNLKKDRLQFINESLEKSLQADFLRKKQTDVEKVKRFIESSKKQPQQPDEYEIWQNEQVWEDE
jgi:metal-responsive CopG/Arc/MetJ family transcriptional regulator